MDINTYEDNLLANMILLKEASLGRELTEMEKEAMIPFVGTIAKAVMPTLSKLVKPVISTGSQMGKNIGRAQSIASAQGKNIGQQAKMMYGAAWRTNKAVTGTATGMVGLGAADLATKPFRNNKQPNVTYQPVQYMPTVQAAPPTGQPQSFQPKLAAEFSDLEKFAEEDKKNWITPTIGLGIATGAGVAGLTKYKATKAFNQGIVEDLPEFKTLGNKLIDLDKMINAHNKAKFEGMFNHITDPKARKATIQYVGDVEKHIASKAGKVMGTDAISLEDKKALVDEFKNSLSQTKNPNITPEIIKYFHDTVDSKFRFKK